MRQFVLAHRLRHVLLRVAKILEYVGNTHIPSGWIRRFYFIIVAGIPSRVVYHVTYIVLLPFAHYFAAAAVATVLYWFVNYRLLRSWVFNGRGSIFREGTLLLLLHSALQYVNFYSIHVLISRYGWYEVFAPVGANIVYGCFSLPLTWLIFWRKKGR